MARSRLRRRSNITNYLPRRDIHNPPIASLLLRPIRRNNFYTSIQDRRLSSYKISAQLSYAPMLKNTRANKSRVLRSYSFEPNRRKETLRLHRDALICVRRKSRREVLFAKRRTGKGARSRPRFNETSQLVCRRR